LPADRVAGRDGHMYFLEVNRPGAQDKEDSVSTVDWSYHRNG
jgi:hypothetical protein